MVKKLEEKYLEGLVKRVKKVGSKKKWFRNLEEKNI